MTDKSLVAIYNDTLKELLVPLQMAMGGEVAQVVEQSIIDSTYQRVYDAYETRSYRRMSMGGLGDINNLSSRTTVNQAAKTVTLYVTNNTPFQAGHISGVDLPTVIAEGRQDYHQPFPRPFMWEAVDDVIDNGTLGDVIVSGVVKHRL